MKRLTIIILCLVTAIAVFAKPPKLNVEKLFDGRFNSSKSVTISIYKSNGNYYRGITVTNNPGIIKKIADAIERDGPEHHIIPTIRTVTGNTRHSKSSTTEKPSTSVCNVTVMVEVFSSFKARKKHSNN